MAALLLQHGARVDATDARGDTPLQVALDLRDADMLKTLSAYNANHTADNDESGGSGGDGGSSSHAGRERGADDTVLLLRSRAAEIEAEARAAAAVELLLRDTLRRALQVSVPSEGRGSRCVAVQSCTGGPARVQAVSRLSNHMLPASVCVRCV
jgi:ankyrin repeat protein